MNILLIRSAPLSQCLALFRYLKEVRYPAGVGDAGVRWIWIVQPSAEKEIRKASEGVEADFLLYDRPWMTYGGLNRLCLERLRRERIDEAYVPYNHVDGRGYGGIIRFLTAAGVSRIVSHAPVKHFRQVTWKGFVLDRIRAMAGALSAACLAALALPFALLYYRLKPAFRR